MTLDDARQRLLRDEDRRVVYRDQNGAEEGLISSVSDRYVHVRYGADPGTKATRADWLEFVNEAAK